MGTCNVTWGTLRSWIWLALLAAVTDSASAQRRWDGQGGDSLWQNARNWQPDGVPLPGDTVLLDHSLNMFDYGVQLPGGTTGVIIRSLYILPGPGRRITLLLPYSNTSVPGLQVTDTGDCIHLEQGALLRNASGASSGDPLQLNGRMRIADGATYVHSTPRGNAKLIDRLSQVHGTENGVFEFDVPGTSGYTVSLTGNTFGSLAFSASSAGGGKSYSGSGTSNCIVRGSLRIASGAALTSTLTADILLSGDLQVDGSLNLSPATAGTAGRSLLLCGRNPQRLSGNGNFLTGAGFRNIECRPGSQVLLSRDLQLPLATQAFIVHDSASLSFGTHAIGGESAFRCLAGSTLDIGSPDGIQATASLGNVRTRTRELSPLASYRFTGTGPQSTGNGLPGNLRTLRVDKPQGNLILGRPIRVTNALMLSKGRVLSRTDSMLTLDSAAVASPTIAYGTNEVGWDSSFVDGPLLIRIFRKGSLPLPLGNDTVHAPVRIEADPPYPLILRAEYRQLPPPQTDVANTGGELRVISPGYWDIRPDTPGRALTAFLTLAWRVVSPQRKDSLKVVYPSTSGSMTTWERAGISHNIAGDAVKGWIRPSQPLTKFGVFALGTGPPDAVLPVKAIHLDAQPYGQGTRLRWSVEGSERWASFRVERSRDGLPFEGIASVEAPNIRDGYAYTHIDDRPPPGRSLYRVTALTDGNEIIHSPVRQVWVRGPQTPRIFPNPVKDALHIQWADRTGVGYAEVIDISGRQHMRLQLSSGVDKTIYLAGLPPGNYLLRLLWDGRTEAYGFIRSDAAGR
jgi:hypothetical protein